MEIRESTPLPKMSMLYRWFKRKNIKWLIKYHENECALIAQVVKADDWAHEAVNIGAKKAQPHRDEIKRLLKQLEEL